MAETIYCTGCDTYVAGPWCNRHPSLKAKFSSRSISASPLSLRWGVLDIETEHMADDVGGWKHIRDDGNWDKLGLSVACVWDSATEHMTPYEREDIHELADHLESLDALCTYNGTRFDLPLAESLLRRPLRLSEHFDLLRAIWDAGGTHNKLGEVSERTLGLSKLGQGSSAPALARDGHWVKLIRYCQWDVHITRKLIEHVRDHGWIIDANGEQLEVGVPEWLLQ